MTNEWTITELHPRFVEFHRFGNKILLNADRILFVAIRETGKAYMFLAGYNTELVVDETYEQVLEILQ